MTLTEFDRIVNGDEVVQRVQDEIRDLVDREGADVVFSREFRQLFSRLASARVRAYLTHTRARRSS